MEDVIFAGTAGRPPLGRAEVLLTIDNADGALPIEYSEVTISRTMFRSGGSEYAINGTPCRLLDVQELLSDSGIGREMHVIVGQGQLDSILHATPEDRRGFIEEAAGVLKHRKRKEKALRKLDSTDGNLTRLGDLLSEIRRQLKPLGRQAEVARKAAVVQADVRDARARILADDLVTARTALEQELADETILVERREEVEAAMAAAREAEGASRRRSARTCPRWRGRRRRGSGCPACASGCAVRRRSPPSGCATPPAPSRRPCDFGRDPDELEAEAERVRAAGVRDRGRGRDAPDRRSRQAVTDRRTAEEAAAEEDRRVAGLRARRGRPSRGTGPARRPGERPEVAGGGRRRGDRPAGVRAGRRGRASRARAARLHRSRDPDRRPRRRRGGARRRARGRRRPCSTTSPSGWPRPARRPPQADRERSVAERPARTRSSSASTARTAPARCSPPPARCPGCWARSPPC